MKESPTVDGKVAVLDTSAFIAGFDPFLISGEQYTVPKVKEEVAKNSMAGLRLKTAEESGKLQVKTPDKAFIDKAKASAILVGDKFFLSETDLQILAIALELKTQGRSVLIITDDYSIQNVANEMGIEFTSLATFGIRLHLQWLRYCPACHREYPADCKTTDCAVCGTKLKRKPLRKRGLENSAK